MAASPAAGSVCLSWVERPGLWENTRTLLYLQSRVLYGKEKTCWMFSALLSQRNENLLVV